MGVPTDTRGGDRPAPVHYNDGWAGELQVSIELGSQMQQENELEEIRRDIKAVVAKLDRLIESKEPEGD